MIAKIKLIQNELDFYLYNKNFPRCAFPACSGYAHWRATGRCVAATCQNERGRFQTEKEQKRGKNRRRAQNSSRSTSLIGYKLLNRLKHALQVSLADVEDLFARKFNCAVVRTELGLAFCIKNARARFVEQNSLKRAHFHLANFHSRNRTQKLHSSRDSTFMLVLPYDFLVSVNIQEKN